MYEAQPHERSRASSNSEASAKLRQMEADHRIANSLQFLMAALRQESRGIQDVEAAQAALANAGMRLMATAQLHRQLSYRGSDAPVELLEFLSTIVESITQSVGAVVELGGDEVTVPAETATQIGVVLNELAINAVKHGTEHGVAPILKVNIHIDGERLLTIAVEDDGPGLPADFNIAETSGLGMTIVLSTLARLGGTMRPVTGAGAAFRIDITLD